MSTFPRLKTNSVNQYPAIKVVEFSTSVLTFVGGSEQRFPNYASSLRRWSIDLRLLDEAELGKLEDFYIGIEGQYGTFAFTDPWDGTTYSSCSLENPELLMRYEGPQNGAVKLIVRENRG